MAKITTEPCKDRDRHCEENERPGEGSGTSPRSVLGPWEIDADRSRSQNNTNDSETALNSEAVSDFGLKESAAATEWSGDDLRRPRSKVHRINRASRKRSLEDRTGNALACRISDRHLNPGLFVSVEHARRKRKRLGRETDPFLVLGSDIMSMIFYKLDARSLAQSILVSHRWQALAASDRFWTKKMLSMQFTEFLCKLDKDLQPLHHHSRCEELWSGKAHLPCTALQRGISKLAAYSISIKDAKRTRIMKEDLCNHAWEFRFKASAPLYWLNLDPSWRGTGPPMRRYFHPDGSQTADPTDKVWGGHECTYSIMTSFTDQGKIREHYVRINRWPKMSVSRKHNWGWELGNHVYCYSSIPDADKDGGTGPLFPVW